MRDGPEEALSSTERIFKTLYMPDGTRGGGPGGWLVGPVGERPVLVCLLHSAQSKYFDGKARKGALDAVRCSRPRDARSVLARSAACMRAPASLRRHKALQTPATLDTSLPPGVDRDHELLPSHHLFLYWSPYAHAQKGAPDAIKCRATAPAMLLTCLKRATRSTDTCCSSLDPACLSEWL